MHNLSRIVTIHPAKEIHRYGFESTQVYRARIARHLGLDYVHLMLSPQLRPDWKKDLIKLGFLEKELEEKIKNIDKDPNLTPEQKEKAKEEARKEAEKVKKSIEAGKTTE